MSEAELDVGLGWVGLGWIGLSWIGLDWFGLDWFGLDWVGVGSVGLDWVGLGWVVVGEEEARATLMIAHWKLHLTLQTTDIHPYSGKVGGVCFSAQKIY